MPTNAASYATAPRRRATSASSSASASGISGVILLVKPGLEDHVRGKLVAQRAIFVTAHSRGRELAFREFAREALVDKRDGHVEARRELAREALRLRGHLVGHSICMRRQADHELRGLPFRNERPDLAPARILVASVDGDERARGSRKRVANRDADAARAEIERDHRRVSSLG